MNAIKQLRTATNMSQARFAEYTRVPVANIQKWEQEVSTPPVYVIYLISKVMEADGYITRSLNSEELDAIRQAKASLSLEGLKPSEKAEKELISLVSGDISREDYQKNLRRRYGLSE